MADQIIEQPTQRSSLVIGLLLLVFLSLLASLYLLGNSAESLDKFGLLHDGLLMVNLVVSLVIFALVTKNAVGLIRELRQGQAGSRFTLRLVLIFVLMSLLPSLIVYTFSVRFLRSGIDSWFNVQIEQSLDNALAISRSSLAEEQDTFIRRTESIRSVLLPMGESDLVSAMNDALAPYGATELALRNKQGLVLATAGQSIALPKMRIDAGFLQKAFSGTPAVMLLENQLGTSGVRVGVSFQSESVSRYALMLEAVYPMDERRRGLAEDVQDTYQQYRRLTFMREPLKDSFVFTLSLVLALSALAAVWIAFRLARDLMRPVQTLAAGTRAVAEGNLDQSLPKGGNDELGYLVNSFNQMVRQLKSASDRALISQAEVEQQRAYLQTVVGSISTGVMTLDETGQPRTVNQAALNMLGIDKDSVLGTDLDVAANAKGPYAVIAASVQRQLALSADTWQEELYLDSAQGRRTFVCRGSRLGEQGGDHVLVFDDISPIIRAQRDAAWSEVARRLAHEIKNPLTPIQLSAERIRHKYVEKLGEDGALMERATNTIVQQVESMKNMVDAFAQYAKTPELAFTELDLADLITDVVELYRGLPSGRFIRMELDDELPAVRADAGRLRQLLHNVIKNALESQSEAAVVSVDIKLDQEESTAGKRLKLQVRDHGPGFPEEKIHQMFEPYVTSKGKGTGLGLAIVKQIVEEHEGEISLSNAPSGGACVTVYFPHMGS